MTDTTLPFSAAHADLAKGMYGSIARSDEIAELRRKVSFRVSNRVWNNKAWQVLTAAAEKGSIAVYVVVDPDKLFPGMENGPVPVPPCVLKRLIRRRVSLQDHAIRPTLKTTGGDLKLCALLSAGTLVVKKREFRRWYKGELDKGRWPSQTTKKHTKPGRGRPAKQTASLEEAILGLVRRKEWSAKKGIPSLSRLLIAKGFPVPSNDTLARLVDRLFLETEQSDLRRKERRRRT